MIKQKYMTRLHTSILNHFIVGLALICPLFGTDYTYYNMPQSIFVNGNVQDTVTASPGNGDMTTIGSGRNPSLNISGSNNSIYSLQVKSPTNVNGVTYYLGGISVNGNISATISNVHTLSLETGSISVGSGTSLHVFSSGNRINAQSSDYGGESKVRFSKSTRLTLNHNSNVKFTNATFFIHDGVGNIANQSTLEAQAITIRLQGELNNRGNLKLTGEVYNIGSQINISTNGISNMTNINGTITINGNLYNGGQAKVDTTGSIFGGFNVFDPQFGGGGNITLYGGSMNVMGNIISSQGGDLLNGGGISNARNSSIGIYGATLTANNLTNKIGSSIIFGAYNDDVGKFTGALNNENSQNASIIIDIAGAKAGTHQIINGNLSGNITIGTHVQLNNGNTEFASTSLGSNNNNQWNGSVTLSINEQAIKSFKSSLNANSQAILSSFGDRIYTLQGATRINIAKDIKEFNKNLQSQFLLTPFSLIDTIKSNTKFDPTIVLQSATSSFISDVNAIGGGVAGSLVGGFGGIKAGFGYRLGNIILYSNIAYMYGSMQGAKNDFVLLDSEFLAQSHSIGLNANAKTYFLTDGKLELDIGLGYFVSLIDSNRNVKLNSPTQSFGSNYGVHQFSLDLTTAYRIEMGVLSISPRVKLIQSYNIISGFSENANPSNNNIAQSISVPQYNAYYMSIAIGSGANWRLGSNKYITFGLDYEHFLFSTQDFHLIFQNGERISFSSPYTSRIGVVIGGRFDINNNISLGIEGIFKTTINDDTNIYYYGVNGVFSYLF
ncbi:hypothetical protein LS73_006765 [Helicobacter muridarum]|uniref:Autotransporter domain-containing protein n=1 Tax=Helicobacter muridarum TaxID=216 RepID=A0A099TZU9_9HELI|nr:hypothetical protein [Helicobacter muridarum]TLD99768.1 hypothetical protein LS73_006765 [Helicobacter muridarum]STQ86999.1 Uncharacterised protein [Helicobacter muridarum]